ncbi:MAG: hypothetical protein MJZ50_02930 [Treponema sp.]|nr:hypothetical protein [Treponema sp.]
MAAKVTEIDGDESFWEFFRGRGRTDGEILKALKFSHDLMKPEREFMRRMKLSQWELDNMDMLVEYREEQEELRRKREKRGLVVNEDIFDLDEDGKRNRNK